MGKHGGSMRLLGNKSMYTCISKSTQSIYFLEKGITEIKDDVEENLTGILDRIRSVSSQLGRLIRWLNPSKIPNYRVS